MEEEFKQCIINMSLEFDELDGCVTCELSVHKDLIAEFEQSVHENTNLKLGKWVLMECDTCVKYHGEGFLHASIEKFQSIPRMEEASNFVKTI